MWVRIPPLAESRAIISSSAFFIPFFRNRGDFMGGRGAGFGGSGKNKVVGVRLIAKGKDGKTSVITAYSISGSKNSLRQIANRTGKSGEKTINIKGGLKAYYDRAKKQGKAKIEKITAAQREKETKQYQRYRAKVEAQKSKDGIGIFGW